MGGRNDPPHRSSSPLKRPASELEEDSTEGTIVVENKDVEMRSPEALTEKSIKDATANKPTTSTPLKTVEDMSSKTEPQQNHDMDSDGADEDEELYASAQPPQAVTSNNVRMTNIDDEPRPPIDEQIRIVEKLVGDFASAELTKDTRAYIVSNTWIEKVKAHGSGAKVAIEIAESDIGPVDNSDIILEVLKDQNNNEFARLKPGVSQDITYFPREAWELCMKWYGLARDQPAIIRSAVDTTMSGDGSNMQFELYPVVFRIHRLWSAASPIPIPSVMKAQNPPPKVFVVSRNDKFVDWQRRIKAAASIESDRLVRMWMSPESLDELKPKAGSAASSRAGTPSPEAQQPIDWSRMLISAEAFNALEQGSQREPSDAKDKTCEKNYNGSSTIDMQGLGKDQRIVLDENVEGHMYLASFVAKLAKGGKGKAAKGSAVTAVKNAKSPTAAMQPDSGRSSPAPVIKITRGREKAKGKTVGCVGLTNLGNTCYMNSALQCIRSVEELTKYFLSGEAQEELNEDNPLGKGGQIAMTYYGLIKDMYKTPVPPSVTPRAFKNTIGRYFPNFSGYGQQDSQEFLGLLLDALQEDLNRIKKKPYIEKPDSTDEMVTNQAALQEMADKVWGITKARDDSVISDLFTGMYKSTVVCPDCAKVSFTFDPFNTVTVQLPIENTFNHQITFQPLNDVPVKIMVDMDKNGSIRSLKEYVSARTGVPSSRLIVYEEFKSQLYKVIEDGKAVSDEITSSNDDIWVAEMEAEPTNWPPEKPKKKKKVKSMLDISPDSDSDESSVAAGSPRMERMLVPVHFRCPVSQNRYNNRITTKPALIPQFIILNPDEVRDEHIIRRKIMEKVQNLTTFNFEARQKDESPEANTDSDMVVTTASDASSGDGKVAAHSVDGEDDVVNVSMKKPETVEESDGKPKLQKIFKTTRPSWLDTSVPMCYARLDRLFSMHYYTAADEIPIGWNTIKNDRAYPDIRNRVLNPKEETRESVEETPEPEEETPPPVAGARRNTESLTSEEDPDDLPELPQTRMNEESSGDELATNTSVRPLPKPKPQSRRLVEYSDSDDDEQTLPLRSAINQSSVAANVGLNRPKKGLVTYSKKNRTSQVSHHFGGDASNDVDETADEGQEPLIRLGEGIVCDWTDVEAYDSMFTGKPYYNTFDSPEELPDPELEEKKKFRQRRRRQGLTLDECLDEFGKEEILSEMDTWYCPRCKEHRRATKKLELWKSPDILVFHLKRFSSSSHRHNKLDIMVDFPNEGLDMTKRVLQSPDGKDEIYDLIAVDNHYGSLGGGHYTACAKSFLDGEWYDYNDSSVSKIREFAQVVSGAAYLLFYRRRSTSPLGGPQLAEVVARFDEKFSADESDSTSNESGSGEGQRLGADSSLNGSSSASAGVGATARGLGAGAGSKQVGRGAAMIESLPDYQNAIRDGKEARPTVKDASMNDAIEMKVSNLDDYQEGDDEAIDLGAAPGYEDGYMPITASGLSSLYNNKPSWGFSTLNDADNGSTPNSPVDFGGADDLMSNSDASDGVQHGSSASSRSMQGRLDDFDAAEVDEDFREATPPPDLPEGDQLSFFDLHNDLRAIARQGGAAQELGEWEGEVVGQGMLNVEVPELMDDEVEDEEEAMEIHVEEGEGLGGKSERK